MSDFRGRGMRGGRSRGGPPRGGFRGGRGGFSSDRERGRGGFGRGRGRGDGFSRGRGGPPSDSYIARHLSRDDDSPPRKSSLLSRGYDSSDRDRGPPMGRRDRYEDSYERGPPPSRSRDPYPSPPRDSSRILDRLSPPRSSLRDRDYGPSSRDYPSSRGDYLPSRSYSPPRDSGFSSHRDTFRSSLREDDRDSFSRPSPRDYPSSRMPSDYGSDRPPRDFRDSPRDYGASSRDYPPRNSDFRSSLGGRGDFRDLPPRDRLSSRDYDNGRDYHSRSGHSDRPVHMDRDYGSSRFSKLDDRSPGRGPREYRGRGAPRGMRGGRDDRGGRGGGFMNGFTELGMPWTMFVSSAA
ncbi:RNA-binding motif protein, X chromosome isoform X4 [Aplysia californica]|uniref:RNA-binding motif protein, X chromosome isoform X4 n=1 Tax=Aplysia californica TaxID=6500 RepID=A0ABM1W098_APLCA|nr:RNA-binding motif protein, X chromosome isoform X4 [Aplysia californica]